MFPAIAQAPTIPPLQELDSNTQLLIENNSFKGNTPLIWGLELAIWEATAKYGLDYDLLYNLAKCESNLIHEGQFGDKKLAYGIYQWHQGSWNQYNKKFGLNLDRYKLEDQIEMTVLVIKDGGQQNWKNCWNKIQGRPN